VADSDSSIEPMIRSLPRQILARLREEIIAGKWAPGERLPSNVLCARFGVSHIPIREAFKVLEAEGFVVLTPNRAAVVTQPTVQDTAEKLQVLDSLETLAAELVCQNAPDSVLKELSALHSEMSRRFHAGDAAGYYDVNGQFHQRIVECCGNATLAEFHQILSRHIQRAREQANVRESLSQISLQQQDLLIKALRSRNVTAARRAMRDHRASVRRQLLQGSAA
jgi:DNA-binding GntR family transcriptional regulator